MEEPREPLARIRRLELELDEVRHRVAVLEHRAPAPAAPAYPPRQVWTAPPAAPPPAPPRSPSPPPRVATRETYLPPRPVVPAAHARVAAAPVTARTTSLEDLVGGRLLPWAGAIAVLLGVAFFVAVAIGRGWLGESARIALAYTGSAALLAAGAWLYERRGRTQAALAMVGTATASAFLTTAAAIQLYALFPTAAGLLVAFAVGSLSTGLALRWDSRTVAGLGTLGALASPVLLGAGTSDAGISFVAVALACCTGVLLLRRWDWLAMAAFAVSAPQLVAWSADEGAPVELVAVALVFWALYMAAALGHEALVRRPRVQPVPALLALAAPLVAAAGGYWALHRGGHPAAGDWLIAGLAATHIGLGIAARRSRRLNDDIAMVLMGGGIAMANTAWGLIAEGPSVAIGWAVSAVALGAVARRGEVDRRLAPVALGVQLCLSLLHVVLYQAPPDSRLDEVGAGAGVGALTSLAVLAAASFACARLTRRVQPLRIGFDVVAMGALAWAAAWALDGAVLTAALAGQAVVLARVAAIDRDQVARFGSLAFLALALGHTVAVEANPVALDLAEHSATAVAGLASLAAALLACARLARPDSEERGVLGAAAAAVLAYLAPFALSGVALVVVWAAGVVALSAATGLLRGVDARVAFGAALGYAGIAAVHVLTFDAPLVALIDGAEHPAAGTAAVAALAAALLAAARLMPLRDAAVRLAIEGAGAATAVYAVSVAIVSAFAQDAGGIDPAVTGLDAHQQGQMVLSAFWAAAGLAALVWGLLRDERSRRIGGLALLSLALAKVFLYDLAALDSIYRVVSFVALGVLLLIGAFAYQRMRPALRAH